MYSTHSFHILIFFMSWILLSVWRSPWTIVCFGMELGVTAWSAFWLTDYSSIHHQGKNVASYSYFALTCSPFTERGVWNFPKRCYVICGWPFLNRTQENPLRCVPCPNLNQPEIKMIDWMKDLILEAVQCPAALVQLPRNPRLERFRHPSMLALFIPPLTLVLLPPWNTLPYYCSK